MSTESYRIHIIVHSKDSAYRLFVNKLFFNKFDLEERKCQTSIPTKFGNFKILAYSQQFIDCVDESFAKMDIIQQEFHIRILENQCEILPPPPDPQTVKDMQEEAKKSILLSDILNVSQQELCNQYITPCILEYIGKNIGSPIPVEYPLFNNPAKKIRRGVSVSEK
jgi:hypothetical protein